MIEVGDFAGWIFAEESGIAEDGGTIGEEMGFESLAEHRGTERTATWAASVGGGVDFLDESFVHATREWWTIEIDRR